MPKLTTPLAKAIRTLEGWLAILVNAAVGIGAAVDPHALPPKEAAIVASVNTGLLVASRTLLKLFAAQAPVLDAPIPVSGKSSKVVFDIEAAAEKLAKAAPAVVKEAETVAADMKAPTSAQVERHASQVQEPAPVAPAPVEQPPPAPVAPQPPAAADPPPAAV